MTRTVFLTAAAIMTASLALAAAPTPTANADVGAAVRAPEGAVPVRLAMGPTSAAHLPGGTGGSSSSASNCSSSTCLSSHKKIKHQTQHSS